MVKASVGKGFVYFFTALFVVTFMVINLVGLFFIFTLFNTAFASASEIDNGDSICLSCHQGAEEYVIDDSVHQNISCTVCHSSASQFPHPKEKKLAQEVQSACQACHAQAAKEYSISIHGDEKNLLEQSTTCASCHGSHDIFKSENQEAKHNRLNINDACISCHDGRVTAGYNWSFHGTAFKAGYEEAANCIDCHGSHTILPEDNPASMVNVANRPATCAKCHDTASDNFAKGLEHGSPFDQENALPLYITLQIFIILILFDVTKDATIAIFDLLKKLFRKKGGSGK